MNPNPSELLIVGLAPWNGGPRYLEAQPFRDLLLVQYDFLKMLW